MRNAKIVDVAFSVEHKKAEEILHDMDNQMPRKRTEITAYVKSEVRTNDILLS